MVLVETRVGFFLFLFFPLLWLICDVTGMLVWMFPAINLLTLLKATKTTYFIRKHTLVWQKVLIKLLCAKVRKDGFWKVLQKKYCFFTMNKYKTIYYSFIRNCIANLQSSDRIIYKQTRSHCKYLYIFFLKKSFCSLNTTVFFSFLTPSQTLSKWFFSLWVDHWLNSDPKAVVLKVMSL